MAWFRNDEIAQAEQEERVRRNFQLSFLARLSMTKEVID
jgi:hypothetical protein